MIHREPFIVAKHVCTEHTSTQSLRLGLLAYNGCRGRGLGERGKLLQLLLDEGRPLFRAIISLPIKILRSNNNKRSAMAARPSYR